MLEMLFPDGLDELPRLSKQDKQAYMLNSLALAYQYSGQPGRTVPLLRRTNSIYLEMDNNQYLSVGLRNLSNALRVTGGLRESEGATKRALKIAQGREDRFGEAASLQYFGLVLGANGETQGSAIALRRSMRLFLRANDRQGEGVGNAFLAQRAIWSGKYSVALTFVGRAWELANFQRLERDFIRAARIQGAAALGLDDLDMADERLHHALTRARAVNHIEEELPALVALAELRRRQNDLRAARELLDEVWEFAERGPYPLFHADALNVLALIGRDAGNVDKATEAATKAYELAWCDGPPYAYHWGLIKAQKHLEELGAPLPSLPPFDESKFEPMPDVEINPKDEFYVEETDEE
jgi:tetratricopeptide (TPR) repeat protein